MTRSGGGQAGLLRAFCAEAQARRHGGATAVLPRDVAPQRRCFPCSMLPRDEEESSWW